MTELDRKLAAIRAALSSRGLAAVRLRGLDWFSWATCGGSAAVLLAAETGIAEALVSPRGAWVLTDDIEASRLRDEELPAGLAVESRRWWDREGADAFVAAVARGGRVASDRPAAGEEPLPPELALGRASLGPEEVDRYRALGRDAAEAVTDVLLAARAEWTGHALAGAAAEALWARGVHPALTLVAGERRLPLYRHPTPSPERLDGRAMLVVCARRHGLYANLTRFVYFRAPSAAERALDADVLRVEAAGLGASRPGATLGDVLATLTAAYAATGHRGEEARHHQGGTCGYLSRDVVATPGSPVHLAPGGAVAWNPSLPGAKVEDTVLVRGDGLDILTVDPRWPTTAVEGRARPAVLVR